MLPKLGPYKVSNDSPASLKEKLVHDYQVYLVNPSIDVVVLRRVNILGAVRNPGLYPVDATMTIADALAVAGGATPEGNADKIEVLRDGERVSVAITRRTRLADSAVRSGDQLFVPERSWLSRNTGIVAALITASVSLAVTLAR
jgi:polysaccharide export outer membrane protein